MDDKPVKDGVRVGADGSFTAEIPLQGSPGEVTIKAEQRDGRRITTETSVIEVFSGDRQ